MTLAFSNDVVKSTSNPKLLCWGVLLALIHTRVFSGLLRLVFARFSFVNAKRMWLWQKSPLPYFPYGESFLKGPGHSDNGCQVDMYLGCALG